MHQPIRHILEKKTTDLIRRRLHAVVKCSFQYQAIKWTPEFYILKAENYPAIPFNDLLNQKGER